MDVDFSRVLTYVDRLRIQYPNDTLDESCPIVGKYRIQPHTLHYGDWANIEFQFKYEKMKFRDLLNRSMDMVLQNIQK